MTVDTCYSMHESQSNSAECKKPDKKVYTILFQLCKIVGNAN